MTVVAMGLLTALIFAENCLPMGRLIGWLAAGALLSYSALVTVVPAALPGMM